MTTEKTAKNDGTQTQPKVVWEHTPTGGPGKNPTLYTWRLVSDGAKLKVESADEADAVGMPRWKAGSLNELPAAGKSYIAGLTFETPKQGQKEMFTPVIDENTPDIIRELAGMQLGLAAKVLVLAITEHSTGLRCLVAALKNRGLAVKGESPTLTAVRLITELTAEKARLESELTATKKKLSLAEKGAGELMAVMIRIQSDLLARRGTVHRSKSDASLCEMASGLLQHLADAMVDVMVESVTTTTTTTVATQTPVFSA